MVTKTQNMKPGFILMVGLLLVINQHGFAQNNNPKQTIEVTQNTTDSELKKSGSNMTAEEFIKSKNLKKPSDRSGHRNIMLNEIAVFDENGKLIPDDVKDDKGRPVMNPELLKRLQDITLASDFYEDENGKLKAQVFRKATAEEQAMKRSAMSKVNNGANSNGSVTKMTVNSENAERKSAVTDPTELVNKKAPAIELKDINGNTISLEKLKGKVVVLNFWFTQCAPCKKEMPELNKLVKKYKGKNVEFIGLCTNDKETLMEFLKTNKFDYRLSTDCAEDALNYGVMAFPANIVIDKESTVHTVKTGYSPGISETLSNAIDECLKK